MNLSDIKKLIKLFENSDVSELEVEQEGLRVQMRKGGADNSPQQISTIISPHPSAQITDAQNTAATSDQPVQTPETGSPKGYIIKSPMVGSFFRSPSPTAPPYVEEGDLVRSGHVLCIIEAMKLMNEIESDVEGKIVKIFPENGKPVEYDEPLFEIEPA